jgi:UDP-N-acetylmuramoylalanine--D-glutamate ligase
VQTRPPSFSALIRCAGKEEALFEKQDLQLVGAHNLENALAAAAAAYLFGVSAKTIRAGVSAYAGIKHRLKLLYNIGGISYFDDTQSTTPESTLAGIQAFSGGIVLLLGGDDKGMDYGPLGAAINQKVKAVILFPGTAEASLEGMLDKSKVALDKADSMSQALLILKRYALQGTLQKGDTVLISPAAAHFYSKFVESTGKDLKEWIREMK